MTHTIQITDFAYDPNLLTISVGDSVQWTNRDSFGHTATRTDPPPFDTGLIAQDTTSAPITFNSKSPTEGLEYYCKPHPHMRGRIVVQ